jgi:hypothetical protein
VLLLIAMLGLGAMVRDVGSIAFTYLHLAFVTSYNQAIQALLWSNLLQWRLRAT